MVGNSCGPTNHPDNDIGHAVLRLSKKGNMYGIKRHASIGPRAALA